VADTFLDTLYMLTGQKRIADATDLIFGCIDRLLSDGDFAAVNAILADADPEYLPSSTRRSFLAITAAAKDKLPARKQFYDKALALLVAERGRDYAEKLLARLA